MTKTQKELTGAMDRLNSNLEKYGYKMEINHRNNYTALDKINLKTGAMIDYFDAGLTDKQALNLIYSLCKVLEMVYNPIN